MSAEKGGPYPHEKRVLRYAYGAAVAATALGLEQALTGNGSLFGLPIPLAALAGLVLVGAIVSVIAIRRRSTPTVLAGAAILVLAVLPGGGPRPNMLAYALGALFGLSILLMGELVHMTERYERAHRAVEAENVPEEHINRVTDEALRTLALRGGIAGLAVTTAVVLAFALHAWGPAQWRAATETTAPLGVAVAALALGGAASLFILARGAAFRREASPKELLPDVAE